MALQKPKDLLQHDHFTEEKTQRPTDMHRVTEHQREGRAGREAFLLLCC